MILRNKRGTELLHYTAIYIILNVIFLAALFVFVAQKSDNIDFQETVEARRITLMIDSMRPGTDLTINLEPLAEIARSRDYGGQIVSFNYGTSEVKVTLSRGDGHSYKYFTKLDTINVKGDGRKEVVVSLG